MSRNYALVIASVFAGACAIAKAAAPEAAQVDRLVAQWDKPNAPGGAIAVYQHGKQVYSRGFGLANLEHQVRNTPATPFHVASVSKQFTAFAIQLLVDDGKLALDDDVRKYVPELRDLGATITVRHLMHHTSGLRDQWALLALAGWRLEDVITEQDLMRVVGRQQSLDFTPGTRHSYSNTGYMLLARIVERVSGRPLAQFAKERIFDPLGMQHTHFQERYGALVPGRASSYEPDDDGRGYRYVALSYSNVGPSSLSTTVEDLARWEANFLKPVVGARGAVARMGERAVLANGREISYASGVAVGSYRGLPTMSHDGADAAFRSTYLRFPEQEFAVALLSNDGRMAPAARAQEVAEIYLGAKMGPKPVPEPRAAKADAAAMPANLEAYAGRYGSPQITLQFFVENGQLQARNDEVQPTALKAVRPGSFESPVHKARIDFDPPGADGVVAGGTLHMNGGSLVLKRMSSQALGEAAAQRYVGEYYSDELHVLYSVSFRAGKLMLEYPRGQLVLGQMREGTTFTAGYPVGEIEFQCEAAACRGFVLKNPRARDLQFSKVSFAAGLLPARPDKATVFSEEPVYLRGSMNGWSMRDRLLPADGGKRLQASILIEPGSHEFKIGSSDYARIDLGQGIKEPAVVLGQTRKLAVIEAGANIRIEVPRRATYRFVLDVADPSAPALTIDPAAPPQ
jgi:CubicO group peptidase (beta-lactamase class C family)